MFEALPVGLLPPAHATHVGSNFCSRFPPVASALVPSVCYLTVTPTSVKTVSGVNEDLGWVPPIVAA